MADTRASIADHIHARLYEEKSRISLEYRQDPKHFVIDRLLPEELARAIYGAFPAPDALMLRKSIREVKYVTSQMNRCPPLLEECVFAFQDPRVLSLIAEVTGVREIEPDAQLYAGGISLMNRGHFLNPHIDNSHDKERSRYRVMNLLYYMSPDWGSECGGNLELWPQGPREAALEIPSRFNRLVVMATGRSSWHSVNPVVVDRPRCCVSNYYFSPLSPESEEYFHVTSFQARPGQHMRQVMLKADTLLRMGLRHVVRGGLFKTRHYYQR